MKMNRRIFAKSLVPVLLAGGGSRAFAGEGLSDAQKKAYQKVFAAAPQQNANLSELSELLRLQETLAKLPLENGDIADFVAKQPMMQAITAGILPALGKLYAWHQASLDATALDHTVKPTDTTPGYYEQFGPARSSRALAIVHIAMFEAVNAITQRAHSYRNIQNDIYSKLGLKPIDANPDAASIDMAICAAARKTLSELFKRQRSIFEATYNVLQVTIADGPAKTLGQKIGDAAAQEILDRRKNDKSDLDDPNAPDYSKSHPLSWAKDPITMLSPALGGNWGKVTPFAMDTPHQFRPQIQPPTFNDARFAKGFDEVSKLGGDPAVTLGAPRWSTPTERKGNLADPLDDANETFKAIFWAYDGTPALCAPPRLYNMIATSIALREKQITTVDEFARYLALVNIALGDAGIGAWEAKYHFAYARPITVLRHVDAAGHMDNGNPHWTPLGGQVTNGALESRNLTPPFPSYPSGHAVFGGALFQIMRNFWQLPASGVPFHFVSDEFNGKNRGPGEAQPRPLVDRSFASFTDAEYENAQSRVWMGIHWGWDRDEGIKQGRQIADHVYASVLQSI